MEYQEPGRPQHLQWLHQPRPGVAQKLYGFLGVGDVVLFPNASGPAMQLGTGYGDWNLSWASWQTGGAIPT